MDGFCEQCGRRPTVADRALQRGIALCADCGEYLCPDCRHRAPAPPAAPAPTLAARRRIDGGLAGLGPFIAVGLIGALALLATQLPTLLGTPGSGGVLDAVQTPGSSQAGVDTTPAPSPAASGGQVAPASPGPTPSASQNVALGPGKPEPDEPVIRTWTGRFGETRVQIILPVRNTGGGWLQLPRSRSTYLINNSEGLEVATGVFTAALPEFVGPGDTAYLVDTLSVAFADPREFRSATTSVDAVEVAQPDTVLSVDGIELSKGPDGGLRATGAVHNEGGTTARSVVAGVVAIGEDGQAVGALFDLTDVGDLEPGATVEFDTEYPGAPPIDGSAPGEVIGYAYPSG
jgi:hypothetical protein